MNNLENVTDPNSYCDKNNENVQASTIVMKSNPCENYQGQTDVNFNQGGSKADDIKPLLNSGFNS